MLMLFPLSALEVEISHIYSSVRAALEVSSSLTQDFQACSCVNPSGFIKAVIVESIRTCYDSRWCNGQRALPRVEAVFWDTTRECLPAYLTHLSRQVVSLFEDDALVRLVSSIHR